MRAERGPSRAGAMKREVEPSGRRARGSGGCRKTFAGQSGIAGCFLTDGAVSGRAFHAAATSRALPECTG